jgi:hypothetical protein
MISVDQSDSLSIVFEHTFISCFPAARVVELPSWRAPMARDMAPGEIEYAWLLASSEQNWHNFVQQRGRWQGVCL